MINAAAAEDSISIIEEDIAGVLEKDNLELDRVLFGGAVESAHIAPFNHQLAIGGCTVDLPENILLRPFQGQEIVPEGRHERYRLRRRDDEWGGTWNKPIDVVRKWPTQADGSVRAYP